jgi:hypothetical protein
MNEEELMSRYADVAKVLDGCTLEEVCYIFTTMLARIALAAEFDNMEVVEFTQELADDITDAYNTLKEKEEEE